MYDGMCISYCDKLFAVCGEEFFDPYVNADNALPFCKEDSLLCSKINEKVSDGAGFCQLMGLDVSVLQEPTLSYDHDCFNGKSSVGVKHKRLDIDYDLINKRDFTEDDEDEDDGPHPLNWDYWDEDGDDIFSNLGQMLFGGSGMVAGLYRHIIGPGMSLSRKLYRQYFKGIFEYVLLALVAGLVYECFWNRKVHQKCCFKEKAKARAPQALKDIGRE